MVTTPYEWKILDWDEKPQTNKQNQNVSFSLIAHINILGFLVSNTVEVSFFGQNLSVLGTLSLYSKLGLESLLTDLFTPLRVCFMTPFYVQVEFLCASLFFCFFVCLLVCLFVCLGFSSHPGNFSIIWKYHLYE